MAVPRALPESQADNLVGGFYQSVLLIMGIIKPPSVNATEAISGSIGWSNLIISSTLLDRLVLKS
jgi:hypothetical protein